MNSKRGLQLLVLFIFSLTFLVMHSGDAKAGVIDDCNLNGGIWCGTDTGSCKGASTINAMNLGNCEVKISQNVTLDKSWTLGLSLDNPKIFEFDSFTVDDTDANSNPIVLQFYNTLYGTGPMAADATCAQDIVCPLYLTGDKSAAYCNGGIPDFNEYSISSGGAGGNGGQESRRYAAAIFGGGGGAGAAGGKIGVSGGDAKVNLQFDLNHYFSGGAGSEGPQGTKNPNKCGSHEGWGWGGYLAYGAGGENGGRGGGILIIQSNSISINGNISVNGENGDDGLPGWGEGDGSGYGVGADGGGPGAGGGGAGSLTLIYNHISGVGRITANGGNGGAGGNGADGRKDADSGSGGGAGGGAGGIIILSGNLANSEDFTGVECSNGIGGEPGILPYNKGTKGTRGQDGPAGSCGDTSEFDPTGSGEINLAYCNDGQDNDGDTKIDMDDYDCRIGIYDFPESNTYHWDASIWTQYSANDIYNHSAKNGTDFVCGDDIPKCVPSATGGHLSCVYLFTNADDCLNPNDDYSCEWREGDLGSLTYDNAYLCLDSVYRGTVNELIEPGNFYAWFGADGLVESQGFSFDNYFVFQAINTQFISNTDEWFYCNADEKNLYGDKNKIEEYGTFMPVVANNQLKCSEAIESVLIGDSFEPSNIWDCEGYATVNLCRIGCREADNCGGYCWKEEGSWMLATFNKGFFNEGCAQFCSVNQDGTFKEIMDYVSGSVSFCSIYPYDEFCMYSSLNWGNLDDAEDMDQDFCANFPEDCLGAVLNADLSCSQVYDLLSIPYSNIEDKICGTDRENLNRCVGGTLYPVSDGYCCVGSNAFCQTESLELSCSDLGGELKDNCNTCSCTGQAVLTNDGACCLNGNWMDMTQIDLGIQDSFICYAENNKNYIKECCGNYGCYNGGESIDNPLNRYNEAAPPVFLMNGVPLHSIVSFDTSDLTRKVKRFQIVSTQPRLLSSLPAGQFMNWSDYDYVEFDVMYNNVAPDYYLILTDNSDQVCNINIKNYISVMKGPNRWQHVTVNILDADIRSRCRFVNFAEIKKIETKSSSSTGEATNIAFDNFFLRQESIGGVNSQNRFCSGNWGDWVENLDGPNANDDKGFFDYNPRPGIVTIGPYQDACNGVISYGWTGGACCGDDTRRNAHGEFWNDNNGACWNGTTVRNGNTVSSALGLSFATSDIWNTKYGNDTRALLYFDSDLWSCNRSLDNYVDYSVSFDGQNSDGQFKDSINPTVQDLYTIKGDWICETKGWIKITEFNRIKPIVSVLKEIGDNKSKYSDGYTLMCGNYSAMSNYISPLLPENNPNSKVYDMTSYACVLKVGNNELYVDEDNEPDYNGFVVIGLVVNNITQSFTEYNELVLSNFRVMNLTDNDCEDVPMSITSDKFFTQCANDNKFTIYYNKPLNLILISDDTPLTGTYGVFAQAGFIEFFQNFWLKFKAFFRNLFGAGNDQPRRLYDFDSLTTNEFYLSVQRDRTIIGSVQVATDGGYNLRVEYENFNSSVRFLRDAIQSNYENSMAVYESDGYKQAIYVNTSSQTTREDWRFITSILRIDIPANLQATKFEEEVYTELTCSDSDGINIGIKGIATNELGSKTDVCKNATTVNEAVCNERAEVIFQEIPCPLGVTCEDGVCGGGQCFDSDGGLNENVFGFAQLRYTVFEDYCLDLHNVKEAVCVVGYPTYETIRCSTGEICKAGVCVTAEIEVGTE